MNALKRDTDDIIWSVLSSFGFSEDTKNRAFTIDKDEAKLINNATNAAKAETVSAVIETIFASGLDNFKVSIDDKNVYDLLVLFGFENILKLDRDIKNGFSVISDHTEIAFGKFEKDITTAKINTKMLLKLLQQKDDGDKNEVSKSLAFAEKNAEGLCYDVCYNLRVNGCIVEYYTENGDIKKAEEYALEKGHSCILRCFADGVLDIKDMSKNEITRTTVKDFLGYYEEECEDEHCDCGHHHDDGCSCGHHHE